MIPVGDSRVQEALDVARQQRCVGRTAGPGAEDAIRLVHHAHRITRTGGSLRRLAAPDPADPTADEPRVRAQRHPDRHRPNRAIDMKRND